MTSARVRLVRRRRVRSGRRRTAWLAVVPFAVALMTMLVLAAPKRVPTKIGCTDTGGFLIATWCGTVPDDGLAGPIIENPIPPPGQHPAIPAGALLIGFLAMGTLVVVTIPKLRQRTVTLR